jgi:hypothetical protein
MVDAGGRPAARASDGGGALVPLLISRSTCGCGEGRKRRREPGAQGAPPPLIAKISVPSRPGQALDTRASRGRRPSDPESSPSRSPGRHQAWRLGGPGPDPSAPRAAACLGPADGCVANLCSAEHCFAGAAGLGVTGRCENDQLCFGDVGDCTDLTGGRRERVGCDGDPCFRGCRPRRAARVVRLVRPRRRGAPSRLIPTGGAAPPAGRASTAGDARVRACSFLGGEFRQPERTQGFARG